MGLSTYLWKIIELMYKKMNFGQNIKLRVFKQIIHQESIVILSYTQSYTHYPQENKTQWWKTIKNKW